VENSGLSKERAARNEALFRQVNERVKEVSDAFAAIDPSAIDFVCECGLGDCVEPIPLTASEYEQVRDAPAQFFLLPGHVLPDVEVVVREGDGYVVVEKLPSEQEIAVETDPRSPS
jgi:hypothetical protein